MSMKSVSPCPGDGEQLANAAAATAFYGTTPDGSNVVGIGNLRVLITKDGHTWFAQGLEIDYAAEGATLPEVKREFENGLMLTLHEHMNVFNKIDNALKIAPEEAWKRFYSEVMCGRYMHSNVVLHNKLSKVVQRLDYYEPKVA